MAFRNLFFSTDIDAAIIEADLIFVSVNTPTKVTGIGAGYSANIKNVELCARKIAEVATSDKIVVSLIREVRGTTLLLCTGREVNRPCAHC